MLIVACIAAALAAAVHGWIFVLETLRWEADATRRIFGTSREQAAASRQLAANQGVYNLLLGVAALVGVAVVLAGSTDAGLAVALTACAVMLGAAAYLVGSDRRKLRPALVQGVPPLVALVTGAAALAA